MSIDNHVAPLPTLSNNLCVTAKSVAGIGTPQTIQAHGRQLSLCLSWFFHACSGTSELWWAGRGCFGRPFPVGGSSNLVQLATQRLEPLSGEIKITTGGCHHGYYPYPRFTCNLSLSLSPHYPFVCGGDRMSHLNLKMEYCLGLAEVLQQDVSDENRERLVGLLHDQLLDLAELQRVEEEEKLACLKRTLSSGDCAEAGYD